MASLGTLGGHRVPGTAKRASGGLLGPSGVGLWPLSQRSTQKAPLGGMIEVHIFAPKEVLQWRMRPYQ